MEQIEDEIFFSCTLGEYEKVWRDYFDLNRDYSQYIDMEGDWDDYLSRAVRFGSGIRILNQDLWEMMISFTISQQNNIKRIKKSIELLCERFGGKKCGKGGLAYYTFPQVHALAKATEEELKMCNLGYRSRYISSIANSILDKKLDLEKIKEMDYADAKKELLKLYGIGEKVADCICLFSLHHLDAFPVDTHIGKVFSQHYPEGFPFEKYKGYSGVIQQYIFYYDLKN